MLHSSLRSKFAIAVHCFGYKIDHDFKGRFLLTTILQSASLIGRYLSVVFCKIMIDERAKLHHRLWLSPKGNIILGVQNIGDNCVIHHNVTLGMGLGTIGTAVAPTVRDNVWIGPNSIIHGDIVIGNGATILAGTVLAKNAMPGCVVSGNPARIIKRNFDNQHLRFSSQYDVSVETINAEDQSDA